MPGQARKVVITERQQPILREYSRSKTLSQQLAQRASIILLAFEGQRNQDIADELRLGRNQVGLWRRRWQDAWEALCLLECFETKQLRQAIRELLSDAPRPGCPGKFSAEQITQILAVACEPPSKSDRPITHWTAKELADEVIQRKIVPSIAVSSVSKLLQRAQLKPHRRKMWLNTTEQNPEVFQRQVEAVCQAYLAAPRLAAESGTHTVSLDEMTGIQALERNAPSREMQPDQPARDEYEYTRHGTTTLIASMDVVSGAITTSSLGPTRTEEDDVAHIQQTIAADPDGTWIFVCDNLNIHLSESLVRFVITACGLDVPPEELGKKQQRDPAEPHDAS